MTKEVWIIKEEENIDLKTAIAKILYKNSYEQTKISEILNLTQPMVSNYIKSNNKISKKIEKLAQNIVKTIKKEKINIYSCITTSKPVDNEPYFLAKKNELINNDKITIINNMTDAFLMLKGKNIEKIAPKVKINMVMSYNPKTTNDIASFGKGFIIIDDKINTIPGISFGKSQHLANLLLYLQSKNIEVNAIMNIKKLSKIPNLKTSYLTKDYKIKDNKQVDIIIHEGDFGIEPCCYILGKDAKDVAKKVLKLIK